MENNETDVELLCTIVSDERRWYMAVVGSLLSLFSAISNAIIAKDRLQLLWLFQLYWLYIGPLLTLCQISMTWSSYLIMLATIERYLITQRSVYLKWFRANRTLLALLILLLSVLLKGPHVFEVDLVKNSDCDGYPLMEYVPSLNHALVDTFVYGTIYKFYIRHLLTVFLPFIVLAVLNYLIVRTLRIQQRSAEMFRFLSSDHKMKIRSATRLMVLIVCSYLVANFLNLVISSWEFIDFESTQTGQPFVIYEFCADLVSLLYVLACATRLPVYYFCNEEIHDAIRQFVCCQVDLPKSHKCSVVVKSVDPNSTKHVGTELDTVAIAIARHFVPTGTGQMKAMQNPFGWKEENVPAEMIITNQDYRNRDIL